MIRVNLKIGNICRHLVGKRSVPSIGSMGFSTVSAVNLPSEKTTLLLRKLPYSTTESALRDALKEKVEFKKLELEPGCLIHFGSEAEATYAKSILEASSSLGCEVSMLSVYPSNQSVYNNLFLNCLIIIIIIRLVPGTYCFNSDAICPTIQLAHQCDWGHAETSLFESQTCVCHHGWMRLCPGLI